MVIAKLPIIKDRQKIFDTLRRQAAERDRRRQEQLDRDAEEFRRFIEAMSSQE
jgi:hypothetical protein